MRKTVIVFLSAVLLLTGCTWKSAGNNEQAVSDKPDFEALASSMDANNTKEDAETSGEGQIDEESREEQGTSGTVKDENTEGTYGEGGISENEPPSAAEPSVKPESTEPPTQAVNKPAVTEPATTKPVETKPSTTQPATTQAATKPAATEPPTTQAATKPAVSADNGALKTFSVTGIDGKTYTQEVFTNADVNVVIFWTTWCGYCKMEMPVLETLMNELEGKSIQFFNVVLNAETDYYREQVKTLLGAIGVTYPCLVYNDSMSDGYVSEITGYPRTIYLNRKGEIMFEIAGAYAANGDDYALNIHREYADYCLRYPDYLPQ
ncbi:MAG: thioredoxin domain-containing protein [Butyrivibrio sp.]